MAKKYDLAVKVGSYTGRDGSQKNRYKNIGAIMTSNDGREYMMLDRTFNPAGVDANGKDSIMVSMFEPRSTAKEETGDDLPF